MIFTPSLIKIHLFTDLLKRTDIIPMIFSPWDTDKVEPVPKQLGVRAHKWREVKYPHIIFGLPTDGELVVSLTLRPLYRWGKVSFYLRTAIEGLVDQDVAAKVNIPASFSDRAPAVKTVDTFELKYPVAGRQESNLRYVNCKLRSLSTTQLGQGHKSSNSEE